jgi:hypothetical protein
MSNVYVHRLEHIPTSNIRQPQPRRNQKYVINRNPSCVVTAAERCALCITKTDYIDRVYYVRQSHRTTKWLKTNCIPANRALRTIWFQKLQTSSQFNNVFLQLNRPLLRGMTGAQKNHAIYETRRFITEFKNLSNGPHSESAKFSPHPDSVLLPSIIMLSSHLRLGLRRDFLPSRLPT